MSAYITVYKVKDFVRFDESGEIDFDRSMQMIREFAMTASIYAGHNILTDLRETTIVGEINIGMVLQLSLEMVRYWSSFKGRIANVVPDDPKRLLIAKNFEITMQVRGFKYKVFTNFEDAIEWLSEVTEVGDYGQKNANTLLGEAREIMNNLRFLIDKYTEKLAELESRISDVKRKLNIVTEASRLLKEEGLLEESPCVVGNL